MVCLNPNPTTFLYEISPNITIDLGKQYPYVTEEQRQIICSIQKNCYGHENISERKSKFCIKLPFTFSITRIGHDIINI